MGKTENTIFKMAIALPVSGLSTLLLCGVIALYSDSFMLFTWLVPTLARWITIPALVSWWAICLLQHMRKP